MCYRDIEQTGPSMASFRRHLMGRMDRGYQPLCLSSAAASLVFKEEGDPFAASSVEGGLTVHVVAASVWPSHLLCATTYSSLLLPPEIAEVKAEFESYFAITNSSSDSHDRVQDTEDRLFSSSWRARRVSTLDSMGCMRRWWSTPMTVNPHLSGSSMVNG
jgi:hypothetical protein